MDIAADGTFILEITDGTGTTDVTTGQFGEIDGNKMDVTIDNQVSPGEVFVEGERAVLRYPRSSIEYEYD